MESRHHLQVCSQERRTHEHDEQVDDLAGVSFHIQDEGVCDRRRRPDDDDDLQTREQRAPACCACGRTEGIKWMIRPGSGDLPVGQLDAQNRFPNGRGIPSLASSERGMRIGCARLE